MDNNNFNVWMIVSSPYKKHVDNYNKINSHIHTNYFSAIDTVNNYKVYADFAVHKKYCTTRFKNQNRHSADKIGNNLSHQLLLEKINESSNTEWNLILEDNIEIDMEKFMKECNNILKEAEKNKSSFIQLYIHPKFNEIQRKRKKEIYKNLYEMCFQFGTSAYFIKKCAINGFIEKFPLANVIDIEYNKMINTWRSLSWTDSGIILSNDQDLLKTKEELKSSLI